MTRALRCSIALALAGCATRSGPAPPPDSATADVLATTAQHFVVESSVADPRVGAAAEDALERAVPILVELTGVPAPGDAPPLVIALAGSDAERLVESGEPLPASGPVLVPARASRARLAASLSLPRPEVAPFLPDSTRTALVHEAAHLWCFRGLPGEARVPASMHEGLAELAAERAELAALGLPRDAIAPSFLRESIAALQNAERRGGRPSVAALLATAPRDAPSPQLWTAAAWWLARTLARRPGGDARLTAWFRGIAAGDDAASSLASAFGPIDALDARLARELAAARPSEIAIGRDVSRLRDRALLLAPVPGTRAWCFEAESRDASAFDWSADVDALGGGAPELWVGFAFDDDETGVRVAIRRNGRATVERVVAGVPFTAVEEELPANAFPKRGTFRLRVCRDGRRVTVTVGAFALELAMPRDAVASSGRFGAGARGGAFVVRGVRLESATPLVQNPGRP